MYKVYCDNYLIFDSSEESLKLLSPKLDLELNKTGSFAFTIYPEHPHFDKLKKLKSIITIYRDGYLLFRGRILNHNEGFYNGKDITCEGELAFLVDSIQRPYDFMSGDKYTTVSDLFTFFITNHNAQVDSLHGFKVGNITVIDPNNYIVRSDSTYLNTWDSIKNKLIDSLGGYLFVRHEVDGNYIDYVNDFATVSSQAVSFGANLLDIAQEIKGEDLATAVIPLGAKISGSQTDERLTIKSVNGGLDYVYNQTAVDKYGWIFATNVWDDVTEADNLKQKGQEYLAAIINLSESIELTAVDLSGVDKDISAFRLGQKVKVVSNPHGLNTSFLVNKLSIDLVNPSANRLTLGATYSTFTEKTSNSSATVRQLVSAGNDIQHSVKNLADEVSQISTEVAEVFLTAHPIGSIYITVDDTDPSTLYGGTWVSFGAGKVLVGVDSTDTDFDAAEETGGSKTQDLRAIIGNVNGDLNAIGWEACDPVKTTYVGVKGRKIIGTNGYQGDINEVNNSASVLRSDGQSPSTIQPYITAYFWKRTT